MDDLWWRAIIVIAALTAYSSCAHIISPPEHYKPNPLHIEPVVPPAPPEPVVMTAEEQARQILNDQLRNAPLYTPRTTFGNYGRN